MHDQNIVTAILSVALAAAELGGNAEGSGVVGKATETFYSDSQEWERPGNSGTGRYSHVSVCRGLEVVMGSSGSFLTAVVSEVGWGINLGITFLQGFPGDSCRGRAASLSCKWSVT